MSKDYKNQNLFHEELFNSVTKYHKLNKKFFGRPTQVIDETWDEIQKFALNGVKSAREIVKKGKGRFVNLFKWGAKDDHIFDLIKIAKKHGAVIAGKTFFKHAKEHKKI